MRVKWLLGAGLAIAGLVALGAPTVDAGVASSAHDFSSGGSNSWKGASDEICIYCHTPHEASIDFPLWNHNATAATFTMYNATTTGSSTLDGTVDSTPGGVSKMCLGCHDGTVAVDSFGGATGTVAKLTSANDGYVGTDLSNDHPISITYEDGTDTSLRADDGTGKSVTFSGTTLPLYSNKVECGSCHDPHDTTNSFFLRKTMTASALCLVCHNK